MRKSRKMESSSSRGEEGWTNGPILQTIAVHLAKMKHWAHFKKDTPVTWYYNYKFFAFMHRTGLTTVFPIKYNSDIIIL